MEPALTLAIALFAGFTQGLAGFGSALVAMTFLSLYMPMKQAVPLVCLFAVCLNLTLITGLKSHIHWPTVRTYAVSMIPGLVAGTYLLEGHPLAVRLALGLTLVGFSLYSLAKKNENKVESGRIWTPVAGFLAGCLGGGIGAWGPPVIIHLSLKNWEKNRTKSTLIAFFIACGLGVMLTQATAGLYDKGVLTTFAMSLPALGLGVYAGVKSYGRLSASGYKKAICAMLLVMGLVTMVTAAKKLIGG